MRLKRLGVAGVASSVLAMVFASAAFATATTSNSHWFAGGANFVSGSTAASKCSAAENFFIKGTIAGSETEIKATTLECLSSTIKQEGENGIATEKLKFSGVSVLKPAGCGISASITTNALTGKIYMEGATVYTQLAPTTGETLASFTLEGCAIGGTYLTKGNVFGQWGNETGIEAVDQKLTFSSAIQATAGGSLKIGANAATLAGKANTELVSGSGFGIDNVPIWERTKHYEKGAKVTWKGFCYEATETNESKEPPNPPWDKCE